TQQMAYAAGRVINDADSHIMESLDWLERYAAPAIRGRVERLRLEAGGPRAAEAIAQAPAHRPDGAPPPAYTHHGVTRPNGWRACGAMDACEGEKACDDLGFSRKLVFTAFAGSQFLPSPDLDVRYGGARALNRAMADFCRSDARLIGVGVVPLDNPERALVEV